MPKTPVNVAKVEVECKGNACRFGILVSSFPSLRLARRWAKQHSYHTGHTVEIAVIEEVTQSE